MSASIPTHRFSPQVAEIQYLPHHHCPLCGAIGRTTASGAWYQPYQDYFASELRYWQDHLGYIYFHCECQLQPNIQSGLRVARLGDAILPVPFVDSRVARNLGQRPDRINADRIRQAVSFLAAEADPKYTSGSDWLMQTLVALLTGGLSPQAARGELQGWIDLQVANALHTHSGIRMLERIDLDLPPA